MSQALLRAARMGQVNKPPPPPAEDEKEPGEEEDAEDDVNTGFVTRRWTLVPRHLEEAEPEYLAKRRKGLPSVYGEITRPLGASTQMRKTKIRKVDMEGNSYVWDVLVPKGQTIEGEIVEEEAIMTEAPAPGTVVEGVGVANAEGVVIAGDQLLPTPPRRRPPPPKRKAKGTGKGKKKRVGFVSISKGGPPAKSVNGGSSGTVRSAKEEQLNLPSDQGPDEADVEMGEESILQDGEDAGDDGSEDDEDGDDGDDGDREEGELSPSPMPTKDPTPTKDPIHIRASTPIINMDISAPEPNLDVPPLPLNREPSSSPDLPLAATQAFGVAVKPAPVIPSLIIEHIPIAQQISVADPSLPEPASAHARIPTNHDPLNGLAAPTIPATSEPERDINFPDGEEDLLGSLERSLGARGDAG